MGDPLTLTLFCVVAAGGGLASALYAARARPIAQRRELERFRDEIGAVVAETTRVRSEWQTTTQELGSYLDAVEDRLGAIEQKRRRIAASESRQKREEGGNGTVDPMAQARARARAAGLPL